MKATAVLAPTDLGGALRILETYGLDAAPLAGGVAWMLHQARGLDLPSVLVSLRSVDGLDSTTREPDGNLVIGSMARLAGLQRSSLLAEVAPGLVDAIAPVGSVRIRSQATIGGNLVAGVARHDPPAMLLALDARVRIAGPDGTREVPFAPWGPDGGPGLSGEVLVAVVVPAVAPRSFAAYRLIRPSGGTGHFAAAVRIDLADDGTIADARIVVGNAGLPPNRRADAERAIQGLSPVAGAAAEAARLAAAGPNVATTGLDEDGTLLMVATRRALEEAFAMAAAVAPGMSRR